MKKFLLTVLLAVLVACSKAPASVQTYPMKDVTVCGELASRLDRNLSRLSEDIYQPPQVFKKDDWPGDFVGRTILGLTMDGEALHRKPAYLDQIIAELPSHLNKKGYFGEDFSPMINEQQLSGHGWLLRGLCEYYKWTGDKSVLPIVKSIAENLFVAAKGRYSSYPIDSLQRSTAGGKESGSISSESSGWMLSTDVGCVFIGMAGLIDAYEVLDEPSVKKTIEEMAGRFLEVDLAGIHAQTHATLSALRGILKFYSLTGDASLLGDAAERWDLYVKDGMTCNYENLNWFGRPDSWTEPCAIVDSYMVAFELWKDTFDPQYRNIAELIYFNALGHTQRFNGGFGCDNCPSPENPFLGVHAPEAYWCCTMRGGEGLARVAESSWAHGKRSLFVPFFRENSLNDGKLSVTENTGYPHDSSAVFRFSRNDSGISSLFFPDLPWTDSVKVTVNGVQVEAPASDGFRAVNRLFVPGDEIRITFSMPLRKDSFEGKTRFFRGPLMLGLETGKAVPADSVDVKSLVPLCHLMDPAVWDGNYRRQILF